ncbi:hypothetical protein [Zavarzinella formosa]|uniref:hypothetical protein n=1 Tax=Zavarzinella formosa TaxID=360055 RepID=UPI0002D278B1|nr:hypothetical protein [Zavarzinella formosa]
MDDENFGGLSDTPPLPPKVPPLPSRSAVPAGELHWGSVGTHDVRPANSHSDLFLLIRTVEGGVTYYSPPAGGEWTPLESPIQFQMIWHGDPAGSASLGGMGRALREAKQSRGSLEPGDKRLRAFDESVSLFLQTVAKLHQASWTCGLTHPGNIHIRRNGSDALAVPVDLGFLWEGDIGEPTWLTPGDNDAYWGSTPRERQYAWQAGPEKIADDVKVVARIIAGAVLGRAPSKSRPSHAEFWGVIAAALAGEIATASELKQALAENPPSGHFVDAPKPVTPPPVNGGGSGGGSKLVPALVALGVLAAVGGGVYFAMSNKDKKDDPTKMVENDKEKKESKSEGTTPAKTPEPKKAGGETLENKKDPITPPKTPKKTPGGIIPKLMPPVEVPESWKDLLNKIAMTDPGQLGTLLKDALDKMTDAPKEEQDKIRPFLEQARQEYFAEWAAKFHQTQTEAKTDIGLLIAEGQMKTLIDDYTKYLSKHPATDESQSQEEKKCLDLASKFLRQLQLR